MFDDPPATRLPHPVPARLVLRPGLRVVRRDDRHLQVGIDPPHRLVAPDEPDVRRVADDLGRGRSPEPDTPAGRRFLADLLAHELVVAGADLDDALATGADRSAVAAAFAQFGADAPRRLAARAAAVIGVDAPEEHRQSVTRLLRASGAGSSHAAADADVLLVVSGGELRRDTLDRVVRAGRPHLVVIGGHGGVTVGPFVVPGLTACLRCVDAQRGESDPRRATVVEQCAQAAPHSGAEPRDPALLAMAVAWAVRDLVSFVDGDQPATWSTSVELGPDLGLVRRRWPRHPHCGCSWGEGLAAG
ncbi:MAG TPA: hypothetical protein VFT00_08625 [Nocardioides sp.]|nr:hypothetical protein [Nocardioides sp.]